MDRWCKYSFFSVFSSDLQAGAKLVLNRQFADERWTKNRVVTCLDWSPQVWGVCHWCPQRNSSFSEKNLKQKICIDSKGFWNPFKDSCFASLLLILAAMFLPVPRTAPGLIQQQWGCSSWAWRSGTGLEHEVQEGYTWVHLPLPGEGRTYVLLLCKQLIFFEGFVFITLNETVSM